VKFLRSKRGLAVIAALFLILFLWRPGIYRLRNRIAGSIGNALGRKVTINNVRLRLLPRPGFDIEDLVIYDDPAFSAEPMVRAQEVTAAIRLRSLLRGRLEIANLSATEPSINLVRNNEGRWNLASLLARNAQIPVAPTAKSGSERRPAFPYLEASSARINFKIGQTKKSYALTDAEVALWQDSENSWGARLKADPVRTDFNLTDTGVIQIDAIWQRAASLQTTPVQIAVQWQKGQLGQVTKLLSGKDRGWRGGLTFYAKLSGTPEALQIDSQAVVDNFHRYDIADRENLRLAASCTGQYSTSTASISDLSCASPVSDGTLRLHGTLASITAPPQYDLTFQAKQVPLAGMIRLLRQSKKQIPSDLSATGLLNAEFHVASVTTTRSEQGRRHETILQPLLQWTGNGSATDVRLSSNGGKDEVAFGTIALGLASGGAPGNSGAASEASSHAAAQAQNNDLEPSTPHLRIGPTTLAIGGTAPVNAGGWISSSGYRFFLRGDMKLQDLFRLENVLALPFARPAADGAAKLDISVSGMWMEFAPPTSLGSAQLRNVRVETHGLSTPIEIASATVSLIPEAVQLQKIVARTGGTHWTGTVTAPRQCAPAGIDPNCAFQFDLTADQFSTGDLAGWFTPHAAQRPWYRILTSEASPGETPLLGIRATGTLRVGRFALKKLSVTQLATHVGTDRGKITLTDLHAQLLQGTHQGNWTVDVSSRDAISTSANPGIHYAGTGVLRGISLGQLGTLMGNSWIEGTADGTFNLNGSANSLSEVPARSDGKMQFAMRTGSLPHLKFPDAANPLLVQRFNGYLLLKKGVWELAGGKLQTQATTYQVNGTASAEGQLNFSIKHGNEESWALIGTISAPRLERREEAGPSEANGETAKP